MIKKLFLATALLWAAAATATVSAQPKIIAHRGHWNTPGSAENSLASFDKAAEIGVYGVEFDVWLTADNKLIVNHDRIYKGTQIDMEKSTLKQITSIRLPNGEHIPTLDAYLRNTLAHPEVRLILEMKSLSDLNREDLAARKIVKMLRKYDLLDRTDIIAFSINACMAFRKLLPQTPIYYLGGTINPDGIRSFRLSGMDYPQGCLRANPAWIDQLHKNNLKVNVWTINTEQDMRYFRDQGVDFITTNAPELLQKVLSETPAAR